MKRRSSQFIDIVIADPSEVAELEHEAARGIFRARHGTGAAEGY